MELFFQPSHRMPYLTKNKVQLALKRRTKISLNYSVSLVDEARGFMTAFEPLQPLAAEDTELDVYTHDTDIRRQNMTRHRVASHPAARNPPRVPKTAAAATPSNFFLLLEPSNNRQTFFFSFSYSGTGPSVSSFKGNPQSRGNGLFSNFSSREGELGGGGGGLKREKTCGRGGELFV